MSVNEMKIEDVYQILNNLHGQTSQGDALTVVDTASYNAVASKTLAVGVDVVYNQLMNTIAKTIFSSRVFNSKFDGIIKDNLKYGGIIRKISMADSDAIEDKAFHDIVDGQSVDHYVVRKNNVQELRWFGSFVYQDMMTVFRDQLVNSFNSAEMLGSFIAMMTQEINNKWTQYTDDLARGILANAIGGKVAMNSDVIYLIDEYNNATGSSLDKTSIWAKENVKPFFEWVKGYIDTLSRRMTERSTLYQVQIDGKKITRHTPYDKQKVYLTSDYLDIINTTVLSEAFHNEELDYRDVRGVSYWQNITEPTSVLVTPSIVDENGAVVTGAETQVDNIFGLMFDEDAIAINIVDNIIVNTPMNARGLYFNSFLTSHQRALTDYSEKMLVLLLDNAE